MRFSDTKSTNLLNQSFTLFYRVLGMKISQSISVKRRTSHLHCRKDSSDNELCITVSVPRLSALIMDTVQRRYRQHDNPSTFAETVSYASSSTLVETTTSASKSLSDPEKCYRSLSQLSTCILSTITVHLDVVSRVCLRSVNRHFRRVIEVDRADLNICARYVIARRLRKDGISQSSLSTTCALCKTSQGRKRYSADQVRYLDDPQNKPAERFVRSLARIPWIRRYTTLDLDLNKRYLYRLNDLSRPKCYAHLMEQFATNPEVEALMPLISFPGENPVWLAFTVLRCMHCGKCISEGDTRLEGCLDCKCDFCFRAPEFQFRRYC